MKHRTIITILTVDNLWYFTCIICNLISKKVSNLSDIYIKLGLHLDSHEASLVKETDING